MTVTMLVRLLLLQLPSVYIPLYLIKQYYFTALVSLYQKYCRARPKVLLMFFCQLQLYHMLMKYIKLYKLNNM